MSESADQLLDELSKKLVDEVIPAAQQQLEKTLKEAEVHQKTPPSSLNDSYAEELLAEPKLINTDEDSSQGKKKKKKQAIIIYALVSPGGIEEEDNFLRRRGVLTLVENKLDGIVRRGKSYPEEEKPPKPQKPPAAPPVHPFQRALSVEDYVAAQRENTNEVMNNFTVRSIATFMKSNTDIYGGGFGRVQLRRGDLMGSDHQMTINSSEKDTQHQDSVV
uniref:Protein lap4 n=1 Tax=Caenorhabditis tropicalis TaxID=1561998 RepID=A0A1I7UWF7_9PELO